MFEELTDKFDQIFKKLRGHGRLSEQNITDAMREVRRALLEADVNYKVAKQFVARITEKAVGEPVLKSLSPGQQVIKIVHEELVELLGGQAGVPALPQGPRTVMLMGLQGSGKTTAAAKLSNYYRKTNRKPFLVAADLQRPAAIDQLQQLGAQLGIHTFSDKASSDAVSVAQRGVREGIGTGADLIVVDTAGRLHVDEALMKELSQVAVAVSPDLTLLVLDGMTGQDAVRVSQEFLKAINFDGVILTKLDSDARGGAALSIRASTGKPIFFAGVGEKLSDLEPFSPDRAASRILGMGDIVSLAEKAQESLDLERAQKLEQKLRTDQLTLDDFLDQIGQLKKMGGLTDVMKYLPGAHKLGKLDINDQAIVRLEAIIQSMTPEERQKPYLIDGSRKRRIARGSGTTVQDVNGLLRQFAQLKKMITRMKKRGKRGMMIPF
jgi:signal recognition particle subunit SRP54